MPDPTAMAIAKMIISTSLTEMGSRRIHTRAWEAANDAKKPKPPSPKRAKIKAARKQRQRHG